MKFQANPYALLFAAAAAISAALGILGWRRRSIPTARSFAAMMLGQTVWALGAGLELLFSDLPTKELCYDLKILGVVSVPPSLLAFVLQYTGRQRWVTRRNIVLTFVVPVITVVVVWTNPWHGLFFSDLQSKTFAGFVVLEKFYGPYTCFHIGYCYSLMALAVVLLARATIYPHGLYRVQVGVILFGALLPWLLNVLDADRMSPIPNIDLTAVAFSLTGLVVASGLARFQILDIAPVARDAVVQGMRDAVVVLDPQGRIVDVNAAAQRVLGKPASQVIGLLAQEVFRNWPALAARLNALDDSTLETQAPVLGKRPVYEATLSRLNNGSQLIGWVLILRDVSGRKRAEEERVRLTREHAARTEAEQANRAKDRFLAILSHELRTPLTPVLAAVSGLLDDGELPEDVRAVLDMTQRNVELEARLIDDLLDVTRIAQGKLRLDRQISDVHQIVRQVIDICGNDIEQAGPRLELDLSASERYAEVDPARMQQVVWNLLKNALKFTPAGGLVTVRSRNLASPSGVRLIIDVSDTGIGIDPETLPRIFEAFEQSRELSARGFGGLGLGLAISRSVVEMHRGRLTAASGGLGQGATFTLDLAVVPAPRTQPLEPVTTPPDGSRASRPLKILLVEDNKDTLRSLSQLLRHRGHDVTPADGLAAAHRAADREGPFDLLLSDIELADGSGLELMRALNGRSVLAGIAMSGYGMEEDIRLSREAGFSQHLIKPIRSDTLWAAIEQGTPIRNRPSSRSAPND